MEADGWIKILCPLIMNASPITSGYYLKISFDFGECYLGAASNPSVVHVGPFLDATKLRSSPAGGCTSNIQMRFRHSSYIYPNVFCTRQATKV